MTEKEKIDKNKLIKKIKRLVGRIMLAFGTGDWRKGMDLVNQGEELIKKFPGDLPKELEEPHCLLLNQKGTVNILKGYLTRGLEIANELLIVAEKYGRKRHVAKALHLIGNYYRRVGDLDEALAYIDRAIVLLKEISNDKDVTSLINRYNGYNDAMEIAIEKDDIKLARKYFERLEEIHELDPEDIVLNNWYKIGKASFLQSSKRSRDKVKAEELFKEIIEDSFAPSIHKIRALVGLCELLLVELRTTGEMEVIFEMKPFLEKLIDLSQQWESDYHLAEAYVLQGKLSLLTFDIKTARRFLMQAHRIAERRGYKGVAEEIASLQDDLKGKLDTWERLKETNAPLSERIKLARLDDHIDGQFRTKIMKMERVEQKEVTVYKDLKTCVVCKGNAGGFNIYVCPKCNSIYCKGCAKAVVEIENACWTCESPIDVTRPSKPFEQEEEEIIIEGKSEKKAPKGEPK